LTFSFSQKEALPETFVDNPFEFPSQIWSWSQGCFISKNFGIKISLEYFYSKLFKRNSLIGIILFLLKRGFFPFLL